MYDIILFFHCVGQMQCIIFDHCDHCGIAYELSSLEKRRLVENLDEGTNEGTNATDCQGLHQNITR